MATIELISEVGNQDCRPSHRKWNAICHCGKAFITSAYLVRRDKVKSCGCSRIGNKNGTKHSTKHGKYGTRTYRSWESMRSRCLYPQSGNFSRYGGRGISFDPRWNKFENFLSDMGERPDGATLDRIDVNGNYCKENCRWATPTQQANNRTDNVFVTYDGKTMTVAQWSKLPGTSKYKTIHGRIQQGWTDPTEILFGRNNDKQTRN